MEEIKLTDAKNHFSELIARAGKGESFTITKHGSPFAQLIPVHSPSTESIRQTFKELDKLSEKNSLDGLNVRDLIEEGRY